MAQCALCPEGETNEGGVLQLKALLSEALGVADALRLPPQIGARIQEVLDLVDECVPTGNT